MALEHVKVWDVPTRLFHWSLALLVLVAFVTGLQGGNWMPWHERAGLAILGLLAFRLVWGFIGSTYARFVDFLPSPARVLDYLRGRWHGLGHNPLGALSVLALLTVLLFQALSGLFANDDIAFDGPLFALVSKSLSDNLTSLHRQAIWPIGGLIALHIAAALFYTLVRGQNIIRAMLTGVKAVAPEADASRAQPARGGGLVALLAALAVAICVVWIAAGGLLPPPPPAPPPPAW